MTILNDLYTEQRELLNRKHSVGLSPKEKNRLQQVERQLYPLLPLMDELLEIRGAIDELSKKVESKRSRKMAKVDPSEAHTQEQARQETFQNKNV